MKKEEILEKSKSENKKKDPYETEVTSKASSAAATAMIFVAFITSVYKACIGEKIDPIVFMMMSIYLAIFSIYYTSKLNKNRKLFIACAIITSLAFIVTTLQYFKVI